MIALASLLILHGTPQEPPRVPLDPKVAYRFPIEFDPVGLNYVVVPARIDGGRTLRLVFDTGVPVPLVLSQETSKSLGLKRLHEEVSVGGLPGEIHRVGTVAIQVPPDAGDLEFSGLDEAFVTDLRVINEGMAQPIDGKPVADPKVAARLRKVFTHGGAKVTALDPFGKPKTVLLPKAPVR